MKFVLSFLMGLLLNSSIAQTGPGGIGDNSSNGIWLRASDISSADNSPVSNWTDFSSYSNDAYQANSSKQPLYFSTSLMNGQPIVRLDGNDDEMEIADHNILDGTAGITYYVAIRPNNLNSAPRGILGKRIAANNTSNYSYTWFFYTGLTLYNDVHTQNNRYNSGSYTFSNSTNYILSFDFDGSLPSSQRSRMFSNGVKIAESNESSTVLPNSNQPVAIGALNVNYGTYLGADYGEIIQFNYSLDSSEHIIVSNYLSAKYGVSLSVNDLYDEDESGNGDFDFQVAGIGRISSTILHDDSQGDAILRINSPSDLNDNEFMLWGHNGAENYAHEFSDVPSGVQARFNRIWRVSEVNTSLNPIDVGSVNMIWDLSSHGAVSASDLRLLIDDDGDGNFITSTQISGAIDLGGGLFQFSSISNLVNNVRFTIGTINTTASPLPIELIQFDANLLLNNVAQINWTTASEINNDYFNLEKSEDGQNWKNISSIDGAGNSSIMNNYEYLDYDVSYGITYYRLKQMDFNGTFSYSDIKAINRKTDTKTKLYPNPTKSIITIEGASQEIENIQVYSILGQNLSNKVSLQFESDQKLNINLNQLKQGTYLIKGKTEIHKIVKK